MSQTFRPRLDILPPAQRRLWPELATLPSSCVLYGGTAIALHLGHRDSVDFDFFFPHAIDPRRLLETLPLLNECTVSQVEPDTLSVSVDRDGPIKLSFFGVPRLGRVSRPVMAEDHGLAVADLLDLGGAKVSVVQVRAEPKDYIDVAALNAAGVTLSQMLSAGAVMYGDAFAPQAALKALCYFDDPLLSSLSVAVKDRLISAVRGVDLATLPNLDPVAPWQGRG